MKGKLRGIIHGEMIFLPSVTRTIAERQIYPLSRYCPGQNFTSEPAASTLLTKKGERN